MAVRISQEEFTELMTAKQPNGTFRLKYNPDNGLHQAIVEYGMDMGLIEEEPKENDIIRFSPEFNIELSDLIDFKIVEPGEEDPSELQGGRRRKTRRRKTKRLSKK